MHGRYCIVIEKEIVTESFAVKPSFHRVVSSLLRSLLNLKFCQKLSTTLHGNTNEFLVKTNNDPQRQSTTQSLG